MVYSKQMMGRFLEKRSNNEKDSNVWRPGQGKFICLARCMKWNT
jgi:hypothetical protein